MIDVALLNKCTDRGRDSVYDFDLISETLILVHVFICSYRNDLIYLINGTLTYRG